MPRTLILLALLWLPVADANTYRINVSESLSYSLGQQQIIAMFSAIYAPLGIQPEFEFLPSERGLQLVNDAELDAEAGRVDLIGARYDNLIAVPVPLSELRLMLLCTDPQYCDLAHETDLAIIAGNLITVWFCEQRQLNCNPVQNDISAYQALSRGRVSRILATDKYALGSLCESGLSTLYSKAASARTFTIYHYVHKKHQALVPKLSAQIKAISQSGQLKQYAERLHNAFSQCQGQLISLD
ncbi:hypothetical protein [Pseudoalteromonas rubra]|uniref:hypothetical protein n=1 Tax=Pseudoalteromonas rubra TaxID=43658 RepID=UPI000F7A6B7F|nr:hypothetical protein [Pseudoalteromonas rubra]